MRVLAVYQSGSRGWGRRIVEFVKENRPAEWEFASYQLPFLLPPVIDQPEEFLPGRLPAIDLLLVLTEAPGLAQLIPDLVSLAAAGAVIAPVDNEEWLPEGLKNQINKQLGSVPAVFPRPFCSLRVIEGRDERINSFARHFGRPEVELELKAGRIGKINIRRDCPCGSTRYLKEHLQGSRKDEAGEKGGLYHQLYPCLASVALIHASAQITAAAVRQAVEEA